LNPRFSRSNFLLSGLDGFRPPATLRVEVVDELRQATRADHPRQASKAFIVGAAAQECPECLLLQIDAVGEEASHGLGKVVMWKQHVVKPLLRRRPLQR